MPITPSSSTPDTVAPIRARKEPGRTAERFSKKNITLPVVMETMRLLTAHGYRAALSRDADQGVARTRPGYVAGGSYTAAGAHAETAARASSAPTSRRPVCYFPSI